MDIESIREYCFDKKGVEESFPFDNDTLVLKVGGKMFLLASLETDPLRINLKCEPEKAAELRELYEAIQPGYHMNKKYWNSVWMDGTIKKELVLELIDHSYELVVERLPKKLREKLT